MLKRSVGGCRMIVSLFAMLALSSQAQLVFDRETSLDEAYAFIGAGTNPTSATGRVFSGRNADLLGFSSVRTQRSPLHRV